MRGQDDAGAGGGQADAARLAVALSQLELLASQAGERLAGAGELSRVADDLAFAGEVGAAVAQGRIIQVTERVRFAAELMIIADGTRPASLVRGGRLLAPRQVGAFGQMFDRFLTDAASSVWATGRIARAGRHQGTGVLIRHPHWPEPVVVTAAHVVAGLAAAVAERGPASLEIDFLGEVGAVGSNRHALGRLLAVGDAGGWTTDFAVIELGRPVDGPLPTPLQVDGDLGSVDPPAQVAIVSYPGVPSGTARAMWPEGAWRDVFEGVWHLKRVSPARAVAGAAEPLIHHDATTTAGSSGGALLSIGTGRLAGLHLGGEGGVNVALRVGVPLGSALTCR